MVDYSRPIEKDYILPMGDLREHTSEKRRAHIIIVTKSPVGFSEVSAEIHYIAKDDQDLSEFTWVW